MKLIDSPTFDISRRTFTSEHEFLDVGISSWRSSSKFKYEFWIYTVSHTNMSWHKYEWVMAYNRRRSKNLIFEWVMFHLWMRHVMLQLGVGERGDGHMNVSCFIDECVVSHIWIYHITLWTAIEGEIVSDDMNESARECVMFHIWMRHVSHMNTSYHDVGGNRRGDFRWSYEWVMFHTTV